METYGIHYEQTYRCLCGSCRNTCCRSDWEILLTPEEADAASEEERHFLRPVRRTEEIAGEAAGGCGGRNMERAALLFQEDGSCPFLDTDSLCAVRRRRGRCICRVCDDFPFLNVQHREARYLFPTPACEAVAHQLLFQKGKVRLEKELLEQPVRRIYAAVTEEMILRRPLLSYYPLLTDTAVFLLQRREFSMDERMVLLCVFADQISLCEEYGRTEAIPGLCRHFKEDEDALDLLQITGYRDVVYGYCMMPDGSGFYIQYHVTDQRLKPGVRRWYGNWVNFHSKNMPEGCGNLRAKIWNPLDHWEHSYVNGKDATDGIRTVETLDMGKSGGGRYGIPSIVHDIDLAECGLSKERMAQLMENGCRASACWEEFEGPGHHLVLRFSRPCPLGGTENINCEWIGYYIRDGKVTRDEQTPVTEEYLRNVLWHNTIERVHLEQLLPELYETYHDLPLDAD